MSKDSSLVSIGMPVYNGGKYICQALDSLLAQDYEDFELIISDNASTDETRAICQEYLEKDKRLRYYRNSNNEGAISNFNRVLGMARGDYFMWAAADDLWEPSYISTLLSKLISAPGAVLAFSAFNSIDEHGEEIRTYPHLFELSSGHLFQRLFHYMRQEEYLGKANLIYGLMRQSVIQAAGGFKVWGKNLWGMDMLIVFRLLSVGDLVLTRELLFHKRLASSSDLSHRGRPASLTARVSQCCSAIQDWHGYFSGYARIINVADALTDKQRSRLRAALWKRASQVYRREIRRALVSPAVRWVGRQSSYLGFSRGV